MNTIWKYELQITDVQTLSVPVGARPLKVGIQKKRVEGGAIDREFGVVCYATGSDGGPFCFRLEDLQ